MTKTNNNFDLSTNYSVSEDSRLTFDQTYNITDYSGGSYTSYEDTTSRLGMSIDMSDVLTLTPSAGFDLYMPDNSSTRKTYRFTMGSEWVLSDTSDLSLSTGVRRTNNDTAWTQEIDYTKAWELFSLDVSSSYDQTPSGLGSLQKSFKFEIGGTYDFAEDWVASLQTSYRTSSQSGSDSGGTSTNVSYSPRVSYVINEDWNTSLTFTERRRKSAGSDTWAVSREGVYALNYNFRYR